MLNELIERTLSGDKIAYGELFQLVKPYLYKMAATRLKNVDDIDDAIQETIIKSYKSLHTLENKKYFKTWITRILINECNNINSNNNRNTTLFNKAVNKFEVSTYIDTTDKIEDTLYMEELLSKLDDDEREIANLYFKDNFTVGKIAELLDSNKNTVKSKLYRIRLKLKKLAILIIVLCIITTTTVFADDIIKFIVSLFTTSRQAIDIAVENDYVQNVDMDFVYSEDIGIKVDYVLIDNKNLNVSYVFDCTSDTDITSVELVDYTIVDENGNKIFSSNLDYKYSGIEHYGEQINLNNGFFRKSNLYITRKYFPLSEKLTFNIKAISVSTNNNFKEITGNWTFEIALEDKFFNRTSENYIASYSEYINSIYANIDKTSLIIDINLNTNTNKDILLQYDSIVLKDSSNKEYQSTFYNFDKDYIYIIFDIGQYNENIDKLNLYIKFDEEKIIDILLKK